MGETIRGTPKTKRSERSLRGGYILDRVERFRDIFAREILGMDDRGTVQIVFTELVMNKLMI